MLRTLMRRLSVLVYFLPPAVLAFVLGRSGRDYGLKARDKLALSYKVFQNSRRPGSASSFLEQLALVRAVLSIPRAIEGDIAEFGCYKGMSSASLSLACDVVGRKLLLFDSFEGLPEPQEMVQNIEGQTQVEYKKGDFAGSLPE